MQCFQKDPNLRISAKRLLRHPWIVSAKRADAVVPVKPTKYDETVRTVQEWNEALKSPENSFRRPPRRGSITPPQLQQNPRPSVITSIPTIKPQAAGKSRAAAPVCPSPDDLNNDNWDDDFDSAISSNGLKLPAHLKPVDNFAGALSADKLKAYSLTEGGNVSKLGLGGGGSSDKLKDAPPQATSDLMDTVRASSPVKAKSKAQTKSKQERPESRNQRSISQPKTQILRGQQQQSAIPSLPTKRPPVKRTSSMFKEDAGADYSDLIVEDDEAFDMKIRNLRKVRIDIAP